MYTQNLYPTRESNLTNDVKSNAFDSIFSPHYLYTVEHAFLQFPGKNKKRASKHIKMH